MSGYSIDVAFDPSWPPAYRQNLLAAASRWMQVVTAPVPPVLSHGERVDGVKVSAAVVAVGTGELAATGPTELRPAAAGAAAFLPVRAILNLGQADVEMLAGDGRLNAVLLHELAHAMGFGFSWPLKGMIADAGSTSPTFTGAAAMAEYGHLLRSKPVPVPVEGTGGAASAALHWREAGLGSELMTAVLASAANPMSRITIASLQDIGYSVDLSKADPYSLPPPPTVLSQTIGSPLPDYTVGRTEPVVLPDEALIHE